MCTASLTQNVSIMHKQGPFFTSILDRAPSTQKLQNIMIQNIWIVTCEQIESITHVGSGSLTHFETFYSLLCDVCDAMAKGTLHTLYLATLTYIELSITYFQSYVKGAVIWGFSCQRIQRENECGMIEAKMKPLPLASELSICRRLWTAWRNLLHVCVHL